MNLPVNSEYASRGNARLHDVSLLGSPPNAAAIGSGTSGRTLPERLVSKNTQMNDAKPNLVGGLNDHCFAFAGESLTELCRLIEAESGEKPTLADLCQILAESLRCGPADLLQDVDVAAIEKLTPKVATSKKTIPKPGDLFAVPAGERGGYYFLLYITSNRFGAALGVFAGRRKLPRASTGLQTSAALATLHTGRTFIASRRWRRIAHRPDLLSLFPASPEIFHSKADNPHNDSIGTYGSAEQASGELRNLTKAEAEQYGLLRGQYRQILLEEQVETLLAKVLG